MDNIFYVYIYLDPRKPGNYIFGDLKFNYEPFYVGKGKNDRINCSDINVKSNEYKRNKINKIKKSGLNIIKHKIIENLTENESYKHEMNLIKTIGRKKNNGPLTNIHKGGSGGDKISHHPNKTEIIKIWKISRQKTIDYNKKYGIKLIRTKEHIKKIIETKQKNKKLGYVFNRKLTDKEKKYLSNFHKGKKLSDETKNKIKIKNIGKIRTEESKIKQSISCKNTLSKIKHKLSKRSKGINNSNIKLYTIELKSTKEKIELIGREKLLIFINDHNNSNYKDYNYLLIQLKKNKIPNFSFISSYNLNHKNF